VLRSTSSVIVFALSTCAVSWAAPPQGSPPRALLQLGGPELGGKLQLRADELSLQPGTRRIALKGHVRIELDTIALQADRLEVALDPRGRPFRLEARGTVRISVGAGRGQAEELTISLSAAGRVLELRRKARLSGIGELALSLEGERIQLDLPSGRLRVSSARAWLGTAPTGSAR
jgi:lipopolysaccharide export system protein LptA